jgi:hypothetical protein
VCAEEVHSPREALGRAVGRPSESDATRTKRMSVIIGVVPTPVDPKPTTKKCRGTRKAVVRQIRSESCVKMVRCHVMLFVLRFVSVIMLFVL